ncbi:MAG: ferrochelatase [Burkholderiales bacterium]|nr:ferrochelatase [Burkholderiales bacterium]
MAAGRAEAPPDGVPGVLLVNLGTPEAPTAAAVRRYLAEFLSDPRVVELPRLVWWPILHGIVLRTRPARSARRYARIWDRDGSPLRLHTERQARLAAGYLGERLRRPIRVEFAMRYGAPSVGAQIERMAQAGVTRILVVPLYPQYCASATASVLDSVARCVQRMRDVPALRWVKDFHADPGYIGSLAALVREHWAREGRPERLLMSFHGVPRRGVDRGDPYAAQCRTTAQRLAAELGLEENQWQMSFQSRFGSARWLEPQTADALVALARAGVRKVAVLCPGFVSDCLETLEEIGIDGKAEFLRAGGAEFSALPCLNETDPWIRALCGLVEANLAGWVSAPPG